MSIGFNAVDLILLGIIILTCYTSYKKGLLLTLYKIIAFFLAIWIAWAINPIVKGALIKHTQIDEWLNENIVTGITEAIDNTMESNDGNENAIEELNLPDFIKDYLKKETVEVDENENQSDGNELVDKINEKLNDKKQNKIAEKVTESLSNVCLTVISFVVVIIIVTIILSLLKGMLQIISDIPIIEVINKLAGAGFGFILASFQIWIVFLIIGLFINVNEENTLYNWISESMLGSWYYNNNLISYIILKLLG